MPELPEVEAARQVAQRVAAGRRIVEAWVADDAIVFQDAPPARLREILTGARVLAAARRGKLLWLELDVRPWPVLHLGMTGSVRAPAHDTVVYKSGPRAEPGAWPPRFTKLRLRFDDGGELAYTNARRLGRVRLCDDPPSEPPVSKLGFDPLLDLPPLADFAPLVRRRRTPLKSLLLDQGFAAGVGNWIADEVLYQAGLAPRRRGPDLSDDELARLHAALGHVIRTAVAAGARSEDFPPDWLFHVRWGKAEGATTADGHAVTFDTIGGRTTAWAPTRQR